MAGEMREGGGNSATGGLTILLRRGIDTVLVPYAKVPAGQNVTLESDHFGSRSCHGKGKTNSPIDHARSRNWR
jgi:hypothetical protein